MNLKKSTSFIYFLLCFTVPRRTNVNCVAITFEIQMKVSPQEIFIHANGESNETVNSNTDMVRNEELDARLEKLRCQMKQYNLSAYIVPNENDHQSEDPAEADKRREYITGFTGSAGHALITAVNATLWTDGRYYLQAEEQLSSTWTLIKQEKASIPDMKNWLIENLHEGDKVGIDPKKITANEWKQLNESLCQSKIELTALPNNLVDAIWEDRPPYSKDPLFVHELKYSGETYESKLERLREKMNQSKSDLLVITKLEEIAWLFNLRGNDLPYSPQFMSYALVTQNSVNLYADINKITSTVEEYLQKSSSKVEIKPYNDFWDDLKAESQKVNKIFIPTLASYAVHLMVPKKSIYTNVSPLLDMKAVKNEIEINGSRNAHIRDSIALCALFKKMEEEIPKGIHWDEIKVADVLDKFRQKFGQDLYKGPSFKTHAAFGPHAAMPHYTSSPKTNVKIDISSPLTLDSGGQYLDGTIDTTRVLHFGEPTEFQKTVYTALLLGVIDLADTVFPNAVPSSSLEILVRRPLLKLGLTFTHGTTHGTGVFSNVHEDFNRTYFEHFIGSQEPGYYLKDNFGMRLENLIVVVKARVQHDENPKKLLEFSPLTLVPYERKLINTTSLDFRQINWLNNYHQKVLNEVGNAMINNGYTDLHTWLKEKTKPIHERKLVI